MTDNIKHMVDDFLLGLLSKTEHNSFLKAMEKSHDLKAEVEFSKEIMTAIKEDDIIGLRKNLNNIMAMSQQENQEDQSIFDLSNNLKNMNVSSEHEPLPNETDNSLQVIHFDNHRKHIKERVHFIDSTTSSQNISSKYNEDFLWDEIREAIQENDIIELRHNLQQITSSVAEINDIEIDMFLNDELNEIQLSTFENKLNSNLSLASQVNLHREIDEAISESDIMSLRNNLHNILENEQKLEFEKIDRIDEFLLGHLSTEEEDSLRNEISNNVQLLAEVNFNAEINEAIMEKEVFNLRNTLHEIAAKNKSEGTKIRQLIPQSFKDRPMKLIGAAASIAAVVSIGAMSLSQHNQSMDKLYLQSYKPYEATGLFRSNAGTENMAMLGVDLYNSKDYPAALTKFGVVLSQNDEHPMCNFYTGLCHQELKDYEKAIKSFEAVINEKDNLFVEQAQWYRALSLLKNNDEAKAYQAFNNIKEKNGYYSRNAKVILKKLK